MALLGELAVNLVSRTSKFEAGMKRSKKRVSEFEKATKLASRALTTLGIGFTGFAIGSFVNQQREMIDDLAKTSRRIGLTTESLGAYRHAAMLSGLSTTELTTALEKMRDTIGAAVSGEAFAARPFEQLGLSAEQLNESINPLEQIQARLNKIGSANERLSIVRDIFGRSGAKILNLYEQDLAGVTKEFERLGLALTSEEADRVEEFNDQLAILSQRFQVTGRELFVDATPRLLKALEGMNIIADFFGGKETAAQTARRLAKEQRGQTSAGFFDFSGNRDPSVALGEFFAALGSRTARANEARPAPLNERQAAQISPDEQRQQHRELVKAVKGSNEKVAP